MKLRSLFFMMCIGMMCISVNSTATEDHEQNRLSHVLSIDHDAGMVQVAILSVESLNLEQPLSEDYLNGFQIKSKTSNGTATDQRFLKDTRFYRKNLNSCTYRYQSNLFSPTRNLSDNIITTEILDHINPGWHFNKLL